MVKCNKCGLKKGESEFNFNKSKNRLEYHCKKCHSDYLKSHYQRNKTYYKKKASKHRLVYLRENYGRIFEYLAEHPCVDCGETNPVLLDFDHVRGKKVAGIAKIVRQKCKWDSVMKEIDKCDVRCVRCHRLKTATQLGWYSWMPIEWQKRWMAPECEGLARNSTKVEELARLQ